MARHIDADALISELQEEIDFESTMYTEEQNKYFNMGLKCALRDVKAQPTADVVPMAEVEQLEYTLAGVMHFVDKWLDGDELNQDEVNRAATMREKTLRIVEELRAEVEATIKHAKDTVKSEVAREIFAEIEDKLLPSNTSGEFRGDSIEWFDYFDLHLAEDIAELKKKYTEGG